MRPLRLPRRLGGRAAAGRRIELAGDPARTLAPEDLDRKGSAQLMLVTNITDVSGRPSTTSRRALTRTRLSDVALGLFERQGFEQTTVAQIAAGAGVTEMTFFRHFSAKHQVLFDDPYDAVIAAAVAAEPSALRPLDRVVRGFRHAFSQVPEPDGDVVRRRVRIIARTATLRGEAWRNNAETEALVVEQLVADGADPLAAKVATAAVLAALTVALFDWSLRDESALGDAITAALDIVEGPRG